MKSHLGQNTILALSVAAIFAVGGCLLNRDASAQDATLHQSQTSPSAVAGLTKLENR